MKKILVTGLIVLGLIVASPGVTLACSQCLQQKSQYTGWGDKAQKCKISKLKKKVGVLWVHKEKLGLKEKQLNKIKDIKHKAIKEMIQLEADKEIVALDLKSEMWNKSINVGAVNKLIDAKYDAKKKLAKTYVKAIGAIQKVLSGEQRDLWHEMLASTKRQGKKYCPKCRKYSYEKICPISGKKLIEAKGSPKGTTK